MTHCEQTYGYCLLPIRKLTSEFLSTKKAEFLITIRALETVGTRFFVTLDPYGESL